MSANTTISFSTPPAFGPIYMKILFGKRRSKFRRGDVLPRLTAECASMPVSQENLAAYRKVCGFQSDAFPLMYPHILAGSLHLAILAHDDFPLSAMGTLHVRNHVLQHRPLHASETVSVTCTLSGSRIVKSGIELDVSSLVCNKDERIWESISTYLVRGKFGEPEDASARAQLEGATPETEVAKWHIAPGTGRRYAKVSGDYNPIHLTPLTAMLFGFKRDIIHGMWMASSCLAHLEAPKADAIQCDFLFKGPNFMNSKVRLLTSPVESGTRFDLFNGGNPKPTISGCQRVVNAATTLVK